MQTEVSKNQNELFHVGGYNQDIPMNFFLNVKFLVQRLFIEEKMFLPSSKKHGTTHVDRKATLPVQKGTNL